MTESTDSGPESSAELVPPQPNLVLRTPQQSVSRLSRELVTRCRYDSSGMNAFRIFIDTFPSKYGEHQLHFLRTKAPWPTAAIACNG